MSQDVLDYVLPEEHVKEYLHNLITSEETRAVDTLKSCLNSINDLSEGELLTFASDLNEEQKQVILKLSEFISPN